MPEISITLPEELVEYMNNDPYIGDKGTFIAMLIRRWQREVASSKGEIVPVEVEQATLTLVKKLRTLKPKPIFSNENGNSLYEGFRLDRFLVQFQANTSIEAEILTIFDLTILVDFSGDDFFKVLQAQVRDNRVDFEELDKSFSLDDLERIIRSVN